MTAQIIDGKTIAHNLKPIFTNAINAQLSLGRPAPGLAVILVGEDPASLIYVRNKRQACAELGIYSEYYALPTATTEQELIRLIQNLNENNAIHGILLQLPLPPSINADNVIDYIDPQKDVDGFHAYNLGCLAQRRPTLIPCTPLGIMLLLQHINQQFKGKHAVVVGASNIVGRPMALALLIAGATTTICHRFTDNLSEYIKSADILISAVGKPNLIQGEWVKPNATVIDVGINRLPDGSITGDVAFKSAAQYAAWITPVPGGVGPMTVTALIFNTLKIAGYLSDNDLLG